MDRDAHVQVFIFLGCCPITLIVLSIYFREPILLLVTAGLLAGISIYLHEYDLDLRSWRTLQTIYFEHFPNTARIVPSDWMGLEFSYAVIILTALCVPLLGQMVLSCMIVAALCAMCLHAWHNKTRKSYLITIFADTHQSNHVNTLQSENSKKM